jgi:hypothetical protein
MTLAQQIKEAKLQLESLQSQIPTKKIGKLTVKIGDKGSINIYGINAKFPVCLYLNQLDKIRDLAANQEFRDFLTENMSKLSIKEE